MMNNYELCPHFMQWDKSFMPALKHAMHTFRHYNLKLIKPQIRFNKAMLEH